MNRNFPLVFLLSFLVGLQSLFAQVDPRIDWKEIETDTAYWVFDANHQDVAEDYIRKFEEAKAKVLPLFKESSRKVTILLLDNTDLANGSASVSPRPTIVLYMATPIPYSAIGDFTDNRRELLIHEYTHILNMEPVHGWMSPFFWIFGSVARPNNILPRWYTEGLAVYTESLLSPDSGRLRSQYLEGLARSLTLSQKWSDYPLADLNDSHLDWLGGSRAYFFGGILWESIVRESNVESIYKMNQSYSRRIPYLLDGVLKDYTKKGYSDQLQSAYAFWQQETSKQIEQIKTAPQVNGTQLRFPEGRHLAPSISGDGLWMASIAHDEEGNGHIYLRRRHPRRGFLGYKPKMVEKKTGAQKVVWNPASTGFVYEKIDTYKTYYSYYDLYFYDLRAQKSTRLTRGARAHQACFSPKGETLYFLSQKPDSKAVRAMDWKTKEISTVSDFKKDTNIQFLNCTAKNTLMLVHQKPGKQSVLVKINPETKKKSIVYNKMPVKFLNLTHKGALISSNKSGVENLYLLKSSKAQPQAITNTLTRTLHADIDPLDDSLYYTQLTAEGPQIFHLKGAQWESLADTPPTIEPIVDWEKPKSQLPEAEAQAKNTTSGKADDFSPWRYMYPNYWIPFVYFVDQGMLFQALSSAGDPLGINTISFIGQWDTLTRRPGLTISYVNRSLPISLGVGASDFYNWFYPTSTSLHFTNFSTLMGYNFSSLGNMAMRFKWNYSALDFDGDIYVRQGPQLELGINKSQTKRNDIAPSSGWRGQLGHRHYLADMGNFDYGETYGHLGTFWSSFTPRRHSFYLGLNGSYAPQLEGDGSAFFAASTLSGPFLNPQFTNTVFMQRGYPTGVFLGQSLININAEYRFPVFDFFSGLSWPPVFLRNLKAALVYDATTLEGGFSGPNGGGAAEIGRFFTGYGMELETSVNFGFYVPVAFTLGLYYGQEQESFGGFTTFFNIRL